MRGRQYLLCCITVTEEREMRGRQYLLCCITVTEERYCDPTAAPEDLPGESGAVT
jgi:hypothetical protein